MAFYVGMTASSLDWKSSAIYTGDTQEYIIAIEELLAVKEQLAVKEPLARQIRQQKRTR